MIVLFFIFLIFCGVIGLVLAPFVAAIVARKNKKTLAEMEKLLEEWENNPRIRTEEARMRYKKNLFLLKGKIGRVDRVSYDRASDIIQDFLDTPVISSVK